MFRFGSYAGTSSATTEIMTALRVNTDLSATQTFHLSKMDLIADALVTVSINGSPYCPLYLDPSDSKYKLSLDRGDVAVKSIKVNQTGVSFYVAFLY
jgi:hypothetical protein